MKTKDLTLIAMMITILIICSQLSLPIGPVPITLQTLAVLMIGFLLTPKHALFATSIYLLMGIAGLPVFSGFTGGIQVFLLPSFGFIFSFIPASYIQASYLQQVRSPKTRQLALAALLNILVTYALGLPYMALILTHFTEMQISLPTVLSIGLLPFIPGDVLKLIVSVLLAKRLLPVIKNRLAVI